MSLFNFLKIVAKKQHRFAEKKQCFAMIFEGEPN
jgi:hypothetical protein